MDFLRRDPGCNEEQVSPRDPDSHRIVGECFGLGTLLLEEDGCRPSE